MGCHLRRRQATALPAATHDPLRTLKSRLARERGGFSLGVVAFAVAISAVLVSTIYAVVKNDGGGDNALHARVDLQLDAVRVLREVTEILKTSGPVDANSDGVFDPGDYPYLWNDGDSNASAFGGHYAFLDGANPGIVQEALSVNEGLGASNEIAFRRPGDPDTFAIVLVPGVDGNELRFRRYHASNEVLSERLLGRHVERIVLESAHTEPKLVVASQPPLGPHQFRVTAWLRRVVDGKTYSARQAGTVNTRSMGK